MDSIHYLPTEVLEYILYNVDQDTIRDTCTQVCQEWSKIIQAVQFWKRYHHFWSKSKNKYLSKPIGLTKYQKSVIPDKMFNDIYHWKLFSYIKPNENPFEINLLKNWDGSMVTPEEIQKQDNRYFEDGFTNPWPTYPFWEVFSSGGKGWKVRTLEIDKENIYNKELIQMYPKLCYVASYHSCTKSQTIDLVKDYGISKNILHNPKYQFDIDIMEWFIMKGPCRYEVIVSLRDENNRMIQELQCDSKFCTEFENGKWRKIHRIITVCGIRRIRFITFYHGATCNEPVPTHENNVQEAIGEWANVCTKMAGASITLSYPTLTKLAKEEQLYSNRYIVYPKFENGKIWTTIDSFGPLGFNKFSLNTFPATATSLTSDEN